MSSQKGFSVVILLVIVGVVVVIGGVVAFNYFLSNSSANITSKAASTIPLNIKTPKTATESGFKGQPASPSATPRPLSSPTPIKTPTASLVSGQVYVTTTLSSDSKTLTIQFKSANNFAGITSISYNLTYSSDSGSRGAQGTFGVGGEISPIVKIITLGTCSTGGTCVYDINPTSFHLSVSTK